MSPYSCRDFAQSHRNRWSQQPKRDAKTTGASMSDPQQAVISRTLKPPARFEVTAAVIQPVEVFVASKPIANSPGKHAALMSRICRPRIEGLWQIIDEPSAGMDLLWRQPVAGPGNKDEPTRF